MQGAQRIPQPAKPADPMLGRTIAGRYRLEARIGEGGMGVVYRARHVLIDRIVAVKLIRPDLRGETHLRAWMLREARAANRVDHAHIIDIHDIGETGESELYLVMEYLVGTSLSSELARGSMALGRGVDILEQMCAALARAHDLGVVHRDLKSDNILLTTRGGRKDFVKILDFGLAHLAMDPRLAPKGAVFGTPEYMAPEQARGEEATPQSDLYALGVLFFEMLTGQLPFRSDDRETLLEMQRTAIAPRPRSIKPDVLPAAESIVVRLLEKDRRKRFQDAHHLHEELKTLQRSLPNTPWDIAAGDNAAPPPPPPPQSPGVIEWASRAALFSRMASRAYPTGNAPSDVQSAVSQAWDLASRASRLEGEVASHTRKLEALERRGRALRAEIGRKVEELAHEESRALRDLSSEQAEVTRLREALQQGEKAVAQAKQAADQASGAARAAAGRLRAGGRGARHGRGAQRAAQGARAEGPAQGSAGARSAPPDRGAARAARRATPRRSRKTWRAGARRWRSERARASASRSRSATSRRLLLNHLKAKPEARDLLQELIAAMHGQSYNTPVRNDSRGPG